MAGERKEGGSHHALALWRGQAKRTSVSLQSATGEELDERTCQRPARLGLRPRRGYVRASLVVTAQTPYFLRRNCTVRWCCD